VSIVEQIDWLNLVDSTGPFLAASVLQNAFPQGFASIETPRRQRLRAAYDEWQDAIDECDPELQELHSAWISMVIREGLEYDDQVLIGKQALGDRLVYTPPDVDETIAPDLAVQTDDGLFRLLVMAYPPGTDLDGPVTERWPTSAAERMTLLCRANDVRLGLATNGERWMLVNAPIGKTSGFASWFARLWWQEPVTLRAFQSLLGMRRAFGPEEDRLETLLDKSSEVQDEVTDTLGEQVRRAVEMLVQALGRADQDRNGLLLKGMAPAELYEAGLTVMMRLVFILCAEERGLLLLGDPIYDQYYAISTLRSRLREDADRYGVEVLERRHDAWSRILSVFRAVYGGIAHETLRMPALGGSLFDPDRFPVLEGREIGTSWLSDQASPLPIDNRTVLLLLDALLVLKHKNGAQLLSYRSLDIEQIGHVYEGLLEYTVKKVDEETVGLIGTQRVPNPHISLSELEQFKALGLDQLVTKLNELTDRSESALRKALQSTPDDSIFLKLVLACHGDEKLANRLSPFAKLIRTDSWDSLLIYQAGSFAIVYGGGRRETGSHYTPRSLTEIIVERTMEPLVFEGPAQGLAREKWKLKSSAELLDLKVCDPAMGSGAFLVQVCRYLGEMLVQAWAREEEQGNAIGVDGIKYPALDNREPLPTDTHERLTIARRLVAERCLYGVDVNQLAVELAKLSIWLVTLAKGRPFGFLNHNLRCGDSILGIDRLEQLLELNMTPESAVKQTTLFGQRIREEVAKTVRLRMDIRSIHVKDFPDVKEIAKLHMLSRAVVEGGVLIADAFVAQVLSAGTFNTALAEKLQTIGLEADRVFNKNSDSYNSLRSTAHRILASDLPDGKPVRKPFHWPLEFPEVFSRERPGFDGIVGNPPFLGNRLWRTLLGEKLQWQVQIILGAKPGKTDLCIAFHRRAAALLREGGAYGLLATTNIAEGTSIPVGLGEVIKHGEIIFCQKRLEWPGKAHIVVAMVCFYKGQYGSKRICDGAECNRIGARLEAESESKWNPVVLKERLFCYEGVNNAKGMKLIVSPDDPWYRILLAEQGSLLRPYVTGKDISDHALAQQNRWALDIGDRGIDEIRDEFPEAYRFLNTVVKPSRTAEVLKDYKEPIDRWWQFTRNRAEQSRTLRKMSAQCIVFSKNTKYPVCLLTHSDWIFTNKVVVIGIGRPDTLAICLSSPFSIWLGRFCGGKMQDQDTLNISIDSINKFPLPDRRMSEDGIQHALAFQDGCVSYASSNNIGVTELMNRVHDPECGDREIAELREHLQGIDISAVEAYQWENIDAAHGSHEAEHLLTERNMRLGWSRQTQETVLSLLLDLNKSKSLNKEELQLNDEELQTALEVTP